MEFKTKIKATKRERDVTQNVKCKSKRLNSHPEFPSHNSVLGDTMSTLVSCADPDELLKAHSVLRQGSLGLPVLSMKLPGGATLLTLFSFS